MAVPEFLVKHPVGQREFLGVPVDFAISSPSITIGARLPCEYAA
jgi:hypothetical protein